ncbi:MAG: hypothetical protein IPK97_15520 [Ahniella sp.]|nr:hypothetical protein [Ahniella sp.]
MRLSKAIFRFSPVLIGACCLLSACATTGVDERVALASLGQETQASQLIMLMVEPAVIVLPKVDDEESNTDDEDSEGPGLIAGLLFDSLGERSRERSLEPITPYIDAQAWARELTDRLSDQGLEEVLAPDASVRVESNPIAAIRSMGEGRGTLLVTLRMGFDHRLEGFFVESEVALQHGEQPAIRARYVSEFINTERYGRWKPIDRRAPNIEYWTRNQGKAIHDALAQAQSNWPAICLQISVSLPNSAPAPCGCSRSLPNRQAGSAPENWSVAATVYSWQQPKGDTGSTHCKSMPPSNPLAPSMAPMQTDVQQPAIAVTALDPNRTRRPTTPRSAFPSHRCRKCSLAYRPG